MDAAAGARAPTQRLTRNSETEWTRTTTLEDKMLDAIYVVLILVFFALSWGLVRLAERL
jgi:hypothetical protein